ncbi:hypothetical protein DFR29_11521 [Tahibacter aquaticus]|uniref:Uncharacterized protein n=1 Tax=Tahibacter aquaticus TaxID=520092 RepID=A0A4R6YPK5_9GAMM|nr:hypothetical protein [Tahibacter aquaticus]TDR39633.1 hypothetical protein DFR29_11521 [Tahibacter aquaticus]
MVDLEAPLLNQLLDGPFQLTARPEPVPGDLRLSWGLALVVLLLGSSKGNKASLQKLHFLAHAARTPESRNETLLVFAGEKRAAELPTRVEPWLNRALSLAAASRLIVLPKGKGAALTEAGVGTYQMLSGDPSILSAEKAFLAAIGKKATEAAVERVLRMESP